MPSFGPAHDRAAMSDPFTPHRGTSGRRIVLEPLRPAAKQDRGAPVGFVVQHLLLVGHYARSFVHGQSPEGVPIDVAQTP